MTISISRKVLLPNNKTKKQYTYTHINFKKELAEAAGLEPTGAVECVLRGNELMLLYTGLGRVSATGARIHSNGTSIAIKESKLPGFEQIFVPEGTTKIEFSKKTVGEDCWLVIDLSQCKEKKNPKGFANLKESVGFQKVIGFAGIEDT